MYFFFPQGFLSFPSEEVPVVLTFPLFFFFSRKLGFDFYLRRGFLFSFPIVTYHQSSLRLKPPLFGIFSCFSAANPGAVFFPCSVHFSFNPSLCRFPLQGMFLSFASDLFSVLAFNFKLSRLIGIVYFSLYPPLPAPCQTRRSFFFKHI